MRPAGFNLATKTTLFKQIGERHEVVNTGFATGDDNVTRGIALTINYCQQVFTARSTPFVALFGFARMLNRDTSRSLSLSGYA